METHRMRYTKKTAVVGVNGKPYALNQALVPSEHFPRGSWAVNLTIAGVPKTISKSTAIQTFNETLRIAQLNNDPVWFIDLWLNCNLQWVARVPARHQIVSLNNLLAISHER